MGLASALRRTTKLVVDKRGREVTITHRPIGDYDRETGTVAAAALKETVKALVEAYKAYEIRGPVEPHDKRLMVPALAVKEPVTTKDEVRIGSDDWRVVSVEEVEVDGLPVFYTVQIRR